MKAVKGKQTSHTGNIDTCDEASLRSTEARTQQNDIFRVLNERKKKKNGWSRSPEFYILPKGWQHFSINKRRIHFSINKNREFPLPADYNFKNAERNFFQAEGRWLRRENHTYRKRWHAVGRTCVNIRGSIFLFKKVLYKGFAFLQLIISVLSFAPRLTWSLKVRELKHNNCLSHHQTWWREQYRMRCSGTERAFPGDVTIKTVLPTAPVREKLPSGTGNKGIYSLYSRPCTAHLNNCTFSNERESSYFSLTREYSKNRSNIVMSGSLHIWLLDSGVQSGRNRWRNILAECCSGIISGIHLLPGWQTPPRILCYSSESSRQPCEVAWSSHHLTGETPEFRELAQSHRAPRPESKSLIRTVLYFERREAFRRAGPRKHGGRSLLSCLRFCLRSPPASVSIQVTLPFQAGSDSRGPHTLSHCGAGSYHLNSPVLQKAPALVTYEGKSIESFPSRSFYTFGPSSHRRAWAVGADGFRMTAPRASSLWNFTSVFSSGNGNDDSLRGLVQQPSSTDLPSPSSSSSPPISGIPCLRRMKSFEGQGGQPINSDTILSRQPCSDW